MKKNLYACSLATVMSIIMATSSFAGVAGKGINPVTNTTQQTQTTTQQNTITSTGTAQATEIAGGYIDQAMSQRLLNAASATRTQVFNSLGIYNKKAGDPIPGDTVIHPNALCQYIAEVRVKELAARNMNLGKSDIYTTGMNTPKNFDRSDSINTTAEQRIYYRDLATNHSMEIQNEFVLNNGVEGNKAMLLQYPDNNLSFGEDFLQGQASPEEAVAVLLETTKVNYFTPVSTATQYYDVSNNGLLDFNNHYYGGAAAYFANGQWYYCIVYDNYRSAGTNYWFGI